MKREVVNKNKNCNFYGDYVGGNKYTIMFCDNEIGYSVYPDYDCENDVQEQLAFERIKKSGMKNAIKYEGDNKTFVWKHPVEDYVIGSQLIVHESQEAVFFRNGQVLDLFGAGRYTLEIQQLPLMEKLCLFSSNAKGIFHSELYYINLAVQMGIKWGTDSKIHLFDPISNLYVELGASGEFNIQVIDSRHLLLKVVGIAKKLGANELLGVGSKKGMFRELIMTQVKCYLAQAIKENNISVLELDEHLLFLSSVLREYINQRLVDYGLFMPEFFIGRIVTSDKAPTFWHMKEK